MDLICQAKGELGQAPVPTPTLETNKQTTEMKRRKSKVTSLFIEQLRWRMIASFTKCKAGAHMYL